jgi:hypothetical protein
VLADLCQNGRMADADQATDEGWLLLVYRVPSEPSRLRAAVWQAPAERSAGTS